MTEFFSARMLRIRSLIKNVLMVLIKFYLQEETGQSCQCWLGHHIQKHWSHSHQDCSKRHKKSLTLMSCRQTSCAISLASKVSHRGRGQQWIQSLDVSDTGCLFKLKQILWKLCLILCLHNYSTVLSHSQVFNKACF